MRVDESDAIDQSTFYEDNDGDGYGTTASTVVACDAPSVSVPATVIVTMKTRRFHPGRKKFAMKSTTTVTALWMERLRRMRTVGTPMTMAMGMEPMRLKWWIVTNLPIQSARADCDGADAAIHPGADEVCDEVDNDCDDEIDNDAIDATTWYFDVDADGFGGEDSG